MHTPSPTEGINLTPCPWASAPASKLEGKSPDLVTGWKIRQPSPPAVSWHGTWHMAHGTCTLTLLILLLRAASFCHHHCVLKPLLHYAVLCCQAHPQPVHQLAPLTGSCSHPHPPRTPRRILLCLQVQAAAASAAVATGAFKAHSLYHEPVTRCGGVVHVGQRHAVLSPTM